MNTTTNTDLSPERKRFGLFCLIMDALYVILGLCFFQYSRLPDVVKNILPYAWIALMGIALVVALIGIFTSKVYDLFRCSLFETIILIAQGVWLGCSKSLMLTSNPQAPFPLYFLIGLFCIFGVGLAIQIDTVWCRSIMHFMTKGAESNLRIAETEPEREKIQRQPVRNASVLRRRTTAPRRQQLAQTQAQPRVQVIRQSQAKTAIKQNQAKARAKQVLAEDFAQNNRRSANRSKNQNTAQIKTSQPRKQPATKPAREHIFMEPEKPAAAPRPKKHVQTVRADQTAPVRTAAPKRQTVAQPRQAAASARRTSQRTSTRENVSDATMKWEPSKIRKAEAAAEQARQREQRQTTAVPHQTVKHQTHQTVQRQQRTTSAPRQTTSRQTPPRKSAYRKTTAAPSPSAQASSTPTPQWATQRKRRPKTHHYTRSASNRLFIRDDDDRNA
ncbi:hypothetical protein [Pseudoramibacter sp.]|uniref:hypothetical protein n=1 Tax=Pseudoramibacter sp. TaxID=2034862 RepID=UPI0025D24B03|nr:hypothetical protein [Pseudoramibacter sp.]MCH4072120.1 hypothetical protein [Pseudoramibacter sp.]MCH4105890.1 hypothetical protein [Pseudoramibacter sp.]